MAKAAASTTITEGAVKGAVKGKGSVKPLPPPTPVKKVAPTKVAPPEPVKPTKAKKPTAAVTSLFEEVPPTKKVSKKIEPKAPVVVLPTKPTKAILARKDPKLDVPTKSKKGVVPKVPDEDVTAADAGVMALPERATAKKVLTKEELATEMTWAKLFNAYLKRDLKQAANAIATLNGK